jgi:hypothetical protein
VDFFDGELDDALVHPLCNLQLLDEFIFYVRDDLVAKVLGFGGESFLDEEPAQDPAKAVVDVVDTGSPPLRGRVRILCMVRMGTSAFKGSG